MTITARDAARLAELFLREHARGGSAATAMTTAIATIARERRTGYPARVLAAVEAICEIDLSSPKRRARTDNTRALAYHLAHGVDVGVGEIAAAIGRDHSSVSKTLATFAKRLEASAELRARVGWLERELVRRIDAAVAESAVG